MKDFTRRKLQESGGMDRLRELLQTRLKESGWTDELKIHCKDIVRERGVRNITVDGLAQEITPRARELVPESVKRELLQEIRSILDPKSPHSV